MTKTETPMGAESRGFDDATEYLLAEMRGLAPDLVWHEYFKPPPGLPGCAGCESEYVCATDSQCPRCRYDLGFTEGMSK